MSLFIGLMSGTSMDGVDAALVDLSKNTLLAGITCDYSQEIHAQLSAFINTGYLSPVELMQLHHQIGCAFAAAALDVLDKAGYTSEDVTAIGSHGQTLYHDPQAAIPTTLQLGCAHTIAEHTGITTVADFRTRDMVLAGQGAPFAPVYHQILFEKHQPLALVNIGGIANLTVLHKNQPPRGYDTGPGNTLLDMWIKKHQNLAYDSNGDWASTGQVIELLLERLLDDAYFKQAAPKSIGIEYFSDVWLTSYFEDGISYSPADVQATLVELTVLLIADAIQTHASQCQHIALCGGGVYNKLLFNRLQQVLPQCVVSSTKVLGVDPDYLEAMMFAWFAKQTLEGKALDLTHTTGAKAPAILGAIYSK